MHNKNRKANYTDKYKQNQAEANTKKGKHELKSKIRCKQTPRGELNYNRSRSRSVKGLKGKGDADSREQRPVQRVESKAEARRHNGKFSQD